MESIEQTNLALQGILTRLNDLFRHHRGLNQLTLNQVLLYLRVIELPGQTMSELCDGLCSTAAATGIVDLLVDLDVVRRAPVPGDRRKIRIHPTAHGVRCAWWAFGKTCSKPKNATAPII